MRSTLARNNGRYEPYAWTACAAAALTLAALTDLTPHRVWGLLAAAGYGAAAVVAVRRGPWAAVVAAVGSVAVPLIALVALGLSQLEVPVIERSANLLLTTGSPYAPAPSTIADFNPYLPGMALFGALPGDARWWMGTTFLATLAGTAAVACPRPRPRPRPQSRGRARVGLVALVACPLVALPLAVGGVDLPVVGLLCLGLALAGRTSRIVRREHLAGLTLGAAAALKWTAWPALPVALALIAVRRGRGPALRYAAVSTATATAAVLPFACTNPAAFYEHAIAFPLGLTGTRSPAASPLPGHLIAEHLPGGRVIALGLLGVSALLLAVSLALRPPTTTEAAARRLALGLGLAMALLPATRFGYLVYPLVLWATARMARTTRTTRTTRKDTSGTTERRKHSTPNSRKASLT